MPHGRGNEIVNVGTGFGLSLTELLAQMEDLVGVKADVLRLPARTFDVERNVLDVDRLTKLTGLVPMSVRDGLELTLAADLASRAAT